MKPHRRAKVVTSSWLFVLVILGDSSWDSYLPKLPNRLRCPALAGCAQRSASGTASRRRMRGRSTGFASAAEPDEEPYVKPRYCPTENRFRLKQAFEQPLSDESSCEGIVVEVKNSSGVIMNVFRVNNDGLEVLQLSINPNQAGVVAACPGQLWRARSSSSDTCGRRRLLSEMSVPPPVPLAGAASTEKMENAPGGTLLWEVLACVGYPLPKSFDVSSSLGGLGNLELSRETKASAHPSADIEGLVTLTLEEAFRGKYVSVTVQRRVLCPACSGFGAASYVSCDRCDGSGKRLHDDNLTNADDAPTSESCGSHCHGRDTATTGNGDAIHECGGHNSINTASGPRVRRNCTCGGGFGRDSVRDLGQAYCRSQHTLNSRSDQPFREQEAAPDGAYFQGDATGGGLRLSHSRDCAKCKGTGKIPAPQDDGGSGYCTRCAGVGFVEAEAELVLSIPAGVAKGQTEMYENNGHIDLAGSLQQNVASDSAAADSGAGGNVGEAPDPAPYLSPTPPPASASAPSASSEAFFSPPRKQKVKTGSFRLTVDVLLHPVFSRGDDGADLYTSVEISLDEALTGFTREITALDGSVVTVRRTTRTLPGMVLRFPGMGMPIAVSSAGRRRPIFAENIKKMSPSANGEAAAPRSGGIEAVQRATMGAIADHGQGVEGDTDAPARETTEFGDLFVETSVTLPSGMRDDRSKLLGQFLKAGSDEAREEQERGESEEGDREWKGKSRGWKRRERRRRAEAEVEATVEEAQEEE